MPDFSIIAQAPEVRQIVQDRSLERAFHESLYPINLFRGEATPEKWAANAGDNQIFTGKGLLPISLKPLRPDQDPTDKTYPLEQWMAQAQLYADSMSTNMPTSMVAIADLFLSNAQSQGLQAATVTNRVVRNRLYNAAMSGNTVVDVAVTGSTTSIHVKRLNGFTTARRPDLAAGSPVRFDTVSTSNPLPVKVFTSHTTWSDNTVVGFSPDVAGDEIGPGTLTLGTAVTAITARDPIYSTDHSIVIIPGGGYSIDDLSNTDIPTLSDIRNAVSVRLRNMNVPVHPDGRFHCHLDPVSEARIFADSELHGLMTALPDMFYYSEFALGQILGCVFFRNNECPQALNVTRGASEAYTDDDPFGGEIYTGGTSAGYETHRMLFTGQGAIKEYYNDLGTLITEAGLLGKVGEFQITNNGIEINTDRIRFYARAPQDKLGHKVTTSWELIADWPVRTDATSGDAARYKREVVLHHT